LPRARSSTTSCAPRPTNLEDELLTPAGEVDIAYFLEASSAAVEGPYDLSLVEGSTTTRSDAERIQQVRASSRALVTIGACATAGGIQALRNWGDVREFSSVVYAQPDYIATLATSTAIAEHVPVDFELRGCPIDKRQLLEVVSALLNGRRPRVRAHSAIDRGRISSSVGLDIAPDAFDDVFEEQPVAHSNALLARVRARESYLTGPLARFNLAFDALSPVARAAALAAGVGPQCRNPFQSIVVRSVELLYACEEALRLIDAYVPPDPPAFEVVPRRAVGCGASEAPRGMCWHRYEIDDDGDGAPAATFIDAVSSGADPGTVHRFDVSAEPLPTSLRGSTSTHALGLADAIELARTLGRLPERVVVYGIEGRSFAAGDPVGAAVTAAVDRVVAELRR
jgi:hydrogenase maturation protease